jgi:hypothetical protein
MLPEMDSRHLAHCSNTVTLEEIALINRFQKIHDAPKIKYEIKFSFQN